MTNFEIQLFTHYPTLLKMWKTSDGAYFVKLKDAQAYSQTLPDNNFVEIARPSNLPPLPSDPAPVNTEWVEFPYLWQWRGDITIIASETTITSPSDAVRMYVYRITNNSSGYISSLLRWGSDSNSTLTVGVGDYVFCNGTKWIKLFDAKKINDIELGKVDKISGKQLSTEDYSTSEKTKLGTIQDRANHTGTQLSSTISDFADSVRSSVLTGFSVASSAVISVTDSILSAMGKLQAQILLKIHTVNSISELQSYTYSSFAYFDGSIWVKKSGDMLSNGGSYAGTIIRVSSSNYWERKRADAMVNVKDFGAKGDGVTDDTQGINNAKAVSKYLFFPDEATYLVSSNITLTGVTIKGQYKYLTKIKKGFNGVLITANSNTKIENIFLDGNGSNFTGRGIEFPAGTGQQSIENCKITNFEGECLYFYLLGGTQSNVNNCEISRYNATINSSLYSIVIEDASNLSAVTRKFIMIESNGLPTFSLGGSNDTFISNCFIGGMQYSANTRGALLSNCRIANQSGFTLSGSNNTITNCDIYPQITISSGTDNCAVANNSYNQLPIIDNSANNRNQITHFNTNYTSTLSSGGTQPTLGNGSILSNYSRNGSIVSVSIELTLGSTTNLGTGGLAFTLPLTSRNTVNQVVSGIGISIGSSFYAANGTIPSGDNKIYLIRDTTSSVTFNSPGTFTTGSTIRMSFSYNI